MISTAVSSRRTGPSGTTSRRAAYATLLLFVFSSALVFVLDSAKDAFDVILQIGAGTGLLYLVRWFWWRVNAWCEVVAMMSSFLVSLALLVLAKNGVHFSTHKALLITIGVTTLCWVATAYLAPPTDRDVLVAFYLKTRPAGPGWAPIRRDPRVARSQETGAVENIPMAILGWVSGCTLVWSALFTIGNFLYGRTGAGTLLLVVSVVSGLTVIWVVRTLWAGEDVSHQPA